MRYRYGKVNIYRLFERCELELQIREYTPSAYIKVADKVIRESFDNLEKMYYQIYSILRDESDDF